MYIMLYCTEHGSYQESTELVQNVIVTVNDLSVYKTMLTSTYVTRSSPTSVSCVCMCICVCVCACAHTCTCMHVVNKLLLIGMYCIYIHTCLICICLIVILVDCLLLDYWVTWSDLLINLTADHMYWSIMLQWEGDYYNVCDHMMQLLELYVHTHARTYAPMATHTQTHTHILHTIKRLRGKTVVVFAVFRQPRMFYHWKFSWFVIRKLFPWTWHC